MNELIASLLRASQHNFIGRLARDPEVKYLDGGSCVANARILINRPGAKRDDGIPPDAFNLAVWGDKATEFADQFRKGQLVDVTGRVKTDTWKDRNTGEERKGLTITVDKFAAVGAAPAAATSTAAPAAKTTADWMSSDNSADDDDIPF